MMGGSVPVADVWRPASLEALTDLFGLLRVISDPEKTETALQRIAEAQASFDAREKAFVTEQERLAELNALVMQRKEAADVLADNSAKLMAEAGQARQEVEALRAELNQDRLAHEGEKKKHAAHIAQQQQTIAVADRAIGEQADAVAKRAANVEAREERVTAREKAVEAQEAAIAAKHAKLAEAMKG